MFSTFGGLIQFYDDYTIVQKVGKLKKYNTIQIVDYVSSYDIFSPRQNIVNLLLTIFFVSNIYNISLI